MNPDGLDIVRDWYNKNLGTPFETTTPPELYHHYVGHDNNRDWTMFTQVETQAVARQLYHEWFPQIVYNHHQSRPVPEPHLGTADEGSGEPESRSAGRAARSTRSARRMRKRFDEEEKPGYSIAHARTTSGGTAACAAVPTIHNMAGFLTETSLYRYGDAALLRGGRDSRDVRRAAQEPAGEDPERRTTRTRGSAAAGRSASRSSTC